MFHSIALIVLGLFGLFMSYCAFKDAITNGNASLERPIQCILLFGVGLWTFGFGSYDIYMNYIKGL